MLDYVQINRKFRNSIHDVRAHRGATGGIGTDHHLLIAKIRIHLKSRKKKTKANRIKLDFTKLNDEKVLAEFQAELAQHRNITEKDDKKLSVNEKFTQFTEYIRGHGTVCFGKDQDYQDNMKEWFTQEIKEVVNKKADAYIQWPRHCGALLKENTCRNRYRMLAKLVKNKVEARQREY